MNAKFVCTCTQVNCIIYFFFTELSKQKKEEKLNLAVKYSKIGKFQRSKRKCA